MAEAYFNFLASKENLKNLAAISAGTHAASGFTAAKLTQKVLTTEGINLSNHLSQPITKDLIREASLVLAMTQAQKELVLEKFPESKGKIFTLKEFANETGDIRDPVGLSEEIYEEVYREIKRSVRLVLNKVKQNESCSWK